MGFTQIKNPHNCTIKLKLNTKKNDFLYPILEAKVGYFVAQEATFLYVRLGKINEIDELFLTLKRV